MTKTHASILSEGVTECGWNQDTQKTLCLDYISTYLGSEGLNNLQVFLNDVAEDELVDEPELLDELEIQNAAILNGISSGTGVFMSPEEILDTIGDVTGWNESTKYQLVCRFLDASYIAEINRFEKVIQQIIIDELNGSFI